MRHLHFGKLLFVVFSLLLACTVSARKPIKTLLITGQNNHNWQVSHVVLKQILENSGRFDVDFAVSPEQGKDMSGFVLDFSPYQLVVLDYNGDSWPEETNRRIVDIISDVNLCYSEHARRYLMECGLPKERTFVTGSPMAEVLHAKPADLIAKAKGFTAELKEARQNVERMKEKILHSDVDRFLYASKNIGGIKVITTTRTDLEAGDLRTKLSAIFTYWSAE